MHGVTTSPGKDVACDKNNPSQAEKVSMWNKCALFAVLIH
jgi:hypothetical protein